MNKSTWEICWCRLRLNLVYEPIFEAIADRLSRAGEDALKALTLVVMLISIG